MKKYFIHLNGTNVGPYSFEDLRSMRIQKTTPVWYDGLGNWQNAGDVSELQALFSSNATTFTTSQNYSKPGSRSTYNFTDDNLSGNIGGQKSGKNAAGIVAMIIVFVVAGIGFAVYTIQKNKREQMDQVISGFDDYQREQATTAQNDVQHTIDSITVALATEEAAIDYGTSSYSGRFNNYDGGILNVTGSDDKLAINLKYNSDNGCGGEISGEGTVLGENKLQVKTSSGCKLTIKYSKGFVTVEESTACIGDHGTKCSFDGIYSREK
ncbi:MAG: DUF4339 domain-containing protein [Bacteroidia bacterium]